MEVMRIGLDLAKTVFEVFGVDKQEKELPRKMTITGSSFWLCTI